MAQDLSQADGYGGLSGGSGGDSVEAWIRKRAIEGQVALTKFKRANPHDLAIESSWRCGECDTYFLLSLLYPLSPTPIS